MIQPQRSQRDRASGPVTIAIYAALVLLVLAALVVPPGYAQGNRKVFLPLIGRPSRQPAAISFFGMNAYVTKVERSGDNLALLAELTTGAGARWTREELVWDLIEPADGNFKPVYDQTLRLAADKGLGVIGILISTPGWARDPSCRPAREAYFCPPGDVGQFAAFAAWMVERYDADGNQDAPGAPRIAAWEIWNEPNDPGNWADIGADGNARKRRYGEALVAAYQAIKAADPSALVVTGGSYIFDGSCAGNNCDGFNFFNADGGVFRQVPQARQAFDVFATHPYAHPERPDAPNRPRIVLLEGTTRQTRTWLNQDIGRPDAPIWITELGWCTAPGACPSNQGVSEDQQANYLVRSLVIAQQSGIQHVSWFQLEDAFNNSNRDSSNAAILRNYNGSSYPAKPAYLAYRMLANTLQGAQAAGVGPVHTYVYDPNQPYTNSSGTYDYRYRRGSETIDVLWRPNDTLKVSFPVAAGVTVQLIDRDGATTTLTPASGGVSLTISERPIIVIQSPLSTR